MNEYNIIIIIRFRESCNNMKEFENNYGTLTFSTICNNIYHNFSSIDCNDRDIVLFIYNNNSAMK